MAGFGNCAASRIKIASSARVVGFFQIRRTGKAGRASAAQLDGATLTATRWNLTKSTVTLAGAAAGSRFPVSSSPYATVDPAFDRRLRHSVSLDGDEQNEILLA